MGVRNPGELTYGGAISITESELVIGYGGAMAEIDTLRYLAQAVETWLQFMEKANPQNPEDKETFHGLHLKVAALVQAAREDRLAASKGLPPPANGAPRPQPDG